MLDTHLNEHFMMVTASGICGYYFPNPQAEYINVGRIGHDQAEEYATRKQGDIALIEKYLSTHLNYK